jgi:hypothetical protein
MALAPVAFQQPPQQAQKPKPQMNIADMIKNFDKTRK